MNQKYQIIYRPDIDGLRAVAILGVLFFHAGLGCQGGFVGVDVFFVISGFLITSLILRDLRERTFSFVDFWVRRVRRIVPALAVMTLGVIVIGYFGMFPKDFEVLGKQVIALVLCVSNVKFLRESGYFDNASDEKPLLHTWSLSVEEQFYFIIPVTLFLVFRFKRQNLAIPLIIIICAISFAVSLYASVSHPVANFYLLPTRAWELGVGSLLAFAGPIGNSRLRQFSSFIGLALILGCYFLFPEGLSFPGASALPPVVGAALLIWSGIGQDSMPAINKFLTLKPIVGIGLISYSLYLWHWPIFAFQKQLGYPNCAESLQFSLLVISFLPAWFSWRYIETPFRNKKIFKKRLLILFLCAASALIGVCCGLSIWLTEGFKTRLNDVSCSVEKCMKSDGGFIRLIQPRDELNLGLDRYSSHIIGKGNQIDFVLLGDSHAGSLAQAFDLKAEEIGLKGAVVQASGIVPLLKGSNLKASNLPQEAIKAVSLLKPKIIYLVGFWSGHFPVNKIENHKSEFRRRLLLTLNFFCEKRIDVVVVQEVPTFKQDPVEYWMTKKFPKRLPLRSLPINDFLQTKEKYLQTGGYFNSLIEEVTNEVDGASTMPVIEVFFKNGKDFQPFDEFSTFYYNQDHLNDYGSNLLLGSTIKTWLHMLVKSQ